MHQSKETKENVMNAKKKDFSSFWVTIYQLLK